MLTPPISTIISSLENYIYVQKDEKTGKYGVTTTKTHAKKKIHHANLIVREVKPISKTDFFTKKN